MGADVVAWLTRLLDRGESVQHAAPDVVRLAAPEAVSGLRQAFARHSLTVAGPPLSFVEQVSIAAAGVVWIAPLSTIAQPAAERVTKAKVLSRESAPMAVSKSAVWYSA